MNFFGRQIGVSGIPVMMYHKFETNPQAPVGECSIRLQDFEEQMRFLCENDFRTLSVAELMDVLYKKKPAKKNSVVLTIDDGHKSSLKALSILKRFDLKASFWIIAGRHQLEGDFMSWREIQNLDRERLFEVGSHSLTHSKEMIYWMEGARPGKRIADVKHELSQSKRILESKLGREVPFFAWPYGYHNRKMIDLAGECGYRGLMSVWEGLNYPGFDPMSIRRTTVNGQNSLDIFIRQLKDGLNHAPASAAEFPNASPQTHKRSRKALFFPAKFLPGTAA